MLDKTPLKYERELHTVFVDFPETLKAGRDYAIDFHYSGTPKESGRFGGFSFGKDPAGKHWITTACEGPGASIWWPNKDQWRDEAGRDADQRRHPERPRGRVERTVRREDRPRRRLHALGLARPVPDQQLQRVGEHRRLRPFRRHGPSAVCRRCDFFVRPGNLEKAKAQFAQARPMIEAFERFFGEYPFGKDGYKLIEVPYSGMEHQSAVTYGNRFANGYLERDWTGVGVSLKFDFIIIHESGHEWFGNAISAADVSDMWIHEGWTTYLENLYVEHVFGAEDALKYINGYKSKVRNREPIVTQRGIHRSPPQDQYFKGALFLNTLRHVVDDDARWWKLLRDFFSRFRYRNILTEDLVQFFNAQLGQDLTPIFDQYLRRAALPTLDLAFNDTEGTMAYRWQADERAFAMPIRIGRTGAWQVIQPTTAWQVMKTPLKKDELEVATDLYYVNVTKR